MRSPATPGHTAWLYLKAVIAYTAGITHYTGAWILLDELGGYRCGWEDHAPDGGMNCRGRNWLYLVTGLAALIAVSSAGTNAGVATVTLLPEAEAEAKVETASLPGEDKEQGVPESALSAATNKQEEL